MRKEILFAIVAGAVFGLVIAFGVWRANLALKGKTAPSAAPQASQTPGPTSDLTNEFGITIAKPDELAVLTESPVALSGITKEDSLVVISAEGEDYVIRAKKDGSFEQEIKLSSGLNEIIIAAIDAEGNQVEKRLLVVYSTEFAKL